jgi:hypothetical protein
MAYVPIGKYKRSIECCFKAVSARFWAQKSLRGCVTGNPEVWRKWVGEQTV